MTFDEALREAKKTPGLGVRETRMSPRWKIVYIGWPKKGKRPAGGDYFCINPITGSNYQYTPSEADRTSLEWSTI